jgi:CDP-diacylglycerol--serine O-phosphatidyltransferase
VNVAIPRRRLRRGIVILPSAFTLGNLFLGIWAIVEASRGQYWNAGWMIVIAASWTCSTDASRASPLRARPLARSWTRWWTPVSFGVAPALLVYFTFFRNSAGEWSWIVCFLYIVAAILRLARFNIEQRERDKAYFHGLPSPISGATLATFYAFTTTDLWQRFFHRVPMPRAAGWLALIVGVLMVSNVLYPVVPRFSFRSWAAD